MAFWHTLAFCSASTQKQENVFTISPSCSISTQMKALVSSSWHHGDAAPRDCTEGGDKEPIGRRDAESEPLLHQHFLPSSTVIIILWRDHKPTWVIKKDLPLTSEWQHWMWLAPTFFITHHLEMPLRAKAEPQSTTELLWNVPGATTPHPLTGAP